MTRVLKDTKASDKRRCWSQKDDTYTDMRSVVLVTQTEAKSRDTKEDVHLTHNRSLGGEKRITAVSNQGQRNEQNE